MNDYISTAEAKRDLNSAGFERLLQSLDEDRERAGVEYEVIRRRLIRLFVSRRCFPGEDLADETLDRVARRLERAPVGNLIPFISGVARIIMLECHRKPKSVDFESLRPADFLKTDHAELSMINREELRWQAESLRRGIGALSPFDRELFLAYQFCAQHRKDKAELALRLGFTEEGLRTRAHRVRRKVQTIALKYSAECRVPHAAQFFA